MCWSAKSSLISFIIGTLINFSVMLYLKNKTITALCLIWQWVLMMQISEYFIWKDLDYKNTNKIGTKMSLIFNLTQPIFVFICLMLLNTNNVNYTNTILASFVIIIYISFFFLQLNKEKEYKVLKPLNNCNHMNLKWWNDIKNSGIIYCISLFSIILLLLRPINLSIFVVTFIAISLLISMKFYSCGSPSMWCWLVVPFPLFFGLFYKNFVKNK